MKYQIDYKEKYFILQDEKPTEDDWMDIEIGTMEDSEITDLFLREHTDTCIYYGIPAYIGKDEDLKGRIDKLYKEYDKNGKL